MVEEVDTTHANYLLGTIQRKGRLLRPCSIKSWSATFAQLRQETGSAQRIMEALKWHRENYSNKYTPIVRSAKAFREKFVNIEAGVQRSPAKVKITKEAKFLYQYVATFNWPKNSKSDLLRVIQISIDRFREFFRKLRSIRKKDLQADRIADEIYSVQNFMLRWMKEVNERITHVSDWKGKLDNFIWSVDHYVFTEMGQQWMRDYTGNPKDWSKLLRRVK